MRKGTIVLTRFPFTNLSSSKRRPAVIVSKVNNNKQDVIVAFISSVIPRHLEETDFLLNNLDTDFNNTGLRKSSVFKLNKLATLEKNIFSGELGFISDKLINEIDKKLLIALDIKKF